MSGRDKRGAARFDVWFPLEIESETTTRQIAVSKDVSQKGILVAMPSKVEVGAEVKVTFKLPGLVPIEHELEGVIVRVERNADDPKAMWRYQVAIQFDDEMPGLETALTVLKRTLDD
jgi:hypothetical protein